MTEEEKLTQSYAILDLLMNDIWGTSDIEYDALEKYKKRTIKFLDDHMTLRNISNLLLPM